MHELTFQLIALSLRLSQFGHVFYDADELLWLTHIITYQLHIAIQSADAAVRTTDPIFGHRVGPLVDEGGYLIPETIAVLRDHHFLENGLVQRADISRQPKDTVRLVGPFDLARSKIELEAAGRVDSLRPRQMLLACPQLCLYCLKRGNIDTQAGNTAVIHPA